MQAVFSVKNELNHYTWSLQKTAIITVCRIHQPILVFSVSAQWIHIQYRLTLVSKSSEFTIVHDLRNEMQVDVISRGLDGVIIKTRFQHVLQQTSAPLKIVVPCTQHTKMSSLSPPVNVYGYCSTVKMCMCSYMQIHRPVLVRANKNISEQKFHVRV